MYQEASFLLSCTIASVLLTLPISASAQAVKEQQVSTDRATLRKLPLQTLLHKVSGAPRDSKVVTRYEAFLSELIRRGTMEVRQLLSEKLIKSGQRDNLEILTAIYRIDKLPDPLTIEISVPEGGFKAKTRDLPVFDVDLKNVALHGEAIWIRKSHCRSDWRIHVWDSNGNLVPRRRERGRSLGALVSEAFLEPGETWETRLSMQDFVDIPEPGKYKVQLFHHDSISISDLADPSELDDLIVFRSEPFEIEVTKGPPMRIRLEPGATRQAKMHIGKFSEQDELRIVDGPYGPRFHKFVSPTSHQGRLLTMGHQAVPALIEALEDKSLSVRKRAWILTLLYSITEERDFDPAAGFDGQGILPSYKAQGVYGSGTGGLWEPSYPANVAAQRKFAQRWLKFRDEYIEISQRKAR